MDVFDLSASLRLNSEEYNKGLDDAEDKAYKWGSRFGKAMKVGAIAVAAVSTAIVGVGAALKKGISATAEYGDNVDKMSQKIGISAEKYQKWDYVMQRAGTSIDSMKMGMKTLSKQAESNSDAFQKLGISQEEVANSSQEELFEKTVKGLADMEQGTERAALASQLLGRAGADMGPLLNGGSKAIEEQMKMAEDYGMVMSDEAVKASAVFEDSVTTMKMTATGLKNRLMGELLPAATKVTDGLALIFKGDYKEGADKVGKGVEDIANKIIKAIPKLAEVGGKILKGIASAIIKNMPKLAEVAVKIIIELVKYLASAAPKMAESAIKIIDVIIKAITDNLPQLLEAAVKIVVALAKAIITNLPRLVVSVAKLAISIPKTILKILPRMLSAGASLIKSLWNGIKNWFGSLFSKLVEKVKGIPRAVGKAVKAMYEAGVNLVKGLWQGIKDWWSNLWNDVRKKSAGLGAVTRKALGIKSPSKVFKDIGKNLVAGLAIGIEQSFGMVESAMNALNDMVQEGVDDDIDIGFDDGGEFENITDSFGIKTKDTPSGAGQTIEVPVAGSDDSRDLTIILELDGTQFARAVYKANNVETQRVGVRMAGAY